MQVLIFLIKQYKQYFKKEQLYYHDNDQWQNFKADPLFINNNPAKETYLYNAFQDDFKNQEKTQRFFDDIFQSTNFFPHHETIFMVETPDMDQDVKQTQVELLFEQYDTKNLYFKNSASLASFLHSKENSIVFDIGGYSTYITTINEGFVVQESSIREKFGGETLTKKYYEFLNSKQGNEGLDFFNFKFTERKNFHNLSEETKKYAIMNLLRDVKENCFKVSSSTFDPNNTVYELPDKKNLVIGKEGNSIPEMMFGYDNQKSILNLLVDVINKLQPNIKNSVLPNIILVGGGTNLRMMFERLNKEISNNVCNDIFFHNKTKFYYCTSKIEKRISSWQAASIIGSMSSFDDFLVSKEDYLEHGFSLIDRRLL